MPKKCNVLFLCTGNSCRSQMAEGWARHSRGDQLNPFSAGTEPRGVDPLAVQVMKEVGVDISAQETHHVRAFLAEDLDLVVTVCGEATKACPAFPGRVRMAYMPFDDPPGLTSATDLEEEKLAVYRRVRDEIRDYVEKLPESHETEQPDEAS